MKPSRETPDAAPESFPRKPRASGPKPAPSLSPAEWEVMKPFWDHGAMAARDVYAALPPGHGWAYKTVKTLLSRLVAKGALEYEQIGNSYLYRPAYSREQLTRKEVKGFIERILEGSLSPIFARFVEDAPLSQEDIRKFRRILDQKEKEKEKEPSIRKKGRR